MTRAVFVFDIWLVNIVPVDSPKATLHILLKVEVTTMGGLTVWFFHLELGP